MIMKWTSIVFILFFISPLFASPPQLNEQEFNKEMPVLTLLAQPTPHLLFCAKRGYVAYQNALAARFLKQQGRHFSLVQGYAWGLVADQLIKKTHNSALIEGQKNALSVIAGKMTRDQVAASKKLAKQIITQYAKSWPSLDEQMKMDNFAPPCDVVFMRASD